MTTKNQKILDEIEISAKSFFDRYKNKINDAHGWEHVLRVVKNCEKILIHETRANSMEVLISAYLHDIGRYKNAEGEHSEWSYLESKEILDKYEKNLNNAADITKIKLMIRYHSMIPDDVPNKDIGNSLEFKILTDADKIDSFGPIGIMRAPLDDRFRTIKKQVEHIKEKSNSEKYKLYSNGGKKIGQEYQDYLLEFLKIYNSQEN